MQKNGCGITCTAILASGYGKESTPETYFQKERILNELQQDNPILICVWNKPDTKWTTTSHYMVLLATDGKQKVYVSNPNGRDGKEKMSGWYSIEEILPYLAKIMYIKSSN